MFNINAVRTQSAGTTRVENIDRRNAPSKSKHLHKTIGCSVLATAALVVAGSAWADTCSQLAARGLDHARLTTAVRGVVPAAGTPNGGLGFPMWLTLVDGSGVVCAVTTSLAGTAGNSDVTADIWLGSRVISAQKANTANAFSNGRLALSTANLYSAVQPGGSLYGLQHSNPVDATLAYRGKAGDFGTSKDGLVGTRVGGVNVFGGGLALYAGDKKIGAIGVSGDTSCTDHVVAWKVRDSLGFAPASRGDKMLQDIKENPNGGTGISATGFGHPACPFNPTPDEAGDSISGNTP